MQNFQALRSARDHVDRFASEDEQFEYHQALVADEEFAAIAHCLDELHAHDIERGSEVERYVTGAKVRLRSALEERASVVESEVQS